MAEYEKRFSGFAQEEMAACIRELEAHVTVRGTRLLSTAEIEELLTLLPSNYFRLLIRMRVRAIAKKQEDFPDKLADLDEAARALTSACAQGLEAEREEDRENWIADMDTLRSVHPALWFRVYKSLRLERLDLAIELEAPDKAVPFKKP